MSSPNAAGTSGARESRLTTLLSQLDRKNIPHFHKVMTKSAVTETVPGPFAYALAFPSSFVTAHRDGFRELAMLDPGTDGEQSWPITITVKKGPMSKLRAFAYGCGGWKTFVVHNHIRVGDTLVFSLVGYSNFVVDIIRAASTEESEGQDSSSDAPTFVEEASFVPCRRCRRVPPSDGPRFVVSVTPTEVKQLRVPVGFWECFLDKLQSRDLQLKGPSGVAMTVEAEGTFDGEEETPVDIHLKSGWEEFFVANDLQAEDVLDFSLVGPCSFLVDVQRL